jgi:hypothetical protein
MALAKHTAGQAALQSTLLWLLIIAACDNHKQASERPMSLLGRIIRDGAVKLARIWFVRFR